MKRNRNNIPSYYSILIILFVLLNSIGLSLSKDVTIDAKTGEATEDELYESLVMGLLEASGSLHGLKDGITRMQAEKIATKLATILKDRYTVDFLLKSKNDQEELRNDLGSNQIVKGLLDIIEEIEEAETFFQTVSPELSFNIMLKENEIDKDKIEYYRNNPLLLRKDKIQKLYNTLIVLSGAGNFLIVNKEKINAKPIKPKPKKKNVLKGS